MMVKCQFKDSGQWFTTTMLTELAADCQPQISAQTKQHDSEIWSTARKVVVVDEY